jgi:hypothetical protein
MDGNRLEGKYLIIKRKALKRAKANNALPKDHLDEFSW